VAPSNSTAAVPVQSCKRGHTSGRGTGLQRRCLECDRQRKKREYKTDGGARKDRCRSYRETNRKKVIERAAERRRRLPEFFMLKSAGRRARKGGYVCTITVHDIVIPKFCPLLGIKLERGNGKLNPASPSLDKIIPDLGYVPGNVWVVSHRANSIKQNATPKELQTLVDNLFKVLRKLPWERT